MLRLLGNMPKVLGMTPTPHPGKALRIMRENAGLSQAELAKGAGVSRAMLSQVESGSKSPSARWLRAVTEAIARGLAGAA